MKSFPGTLTPESKDRFLSYYYERVKSYLRRDLYEHILSHTENEYFDLTKFSNERWKDMSSVKQMTKEVMEELTKLGWKCKLSYGETGLFIYSTSIPPPSCWDEDEVLE